MDDGERVLGHGLRPALCRFYRLMIRSLDKDRQVWNGSATAMKRLSRREVLGALGLAATSGWALAQAGESKSDAPADPGWHYLPVAAEEVAAEAYRLKGDNGCMYSVFRAVLSAWAKQSGQSVEAFPFHMFQYGDGGIGHWGTVCGTLNGSAALFGLFETDKKRREALIDELYRWYESTELPAYSPAADARPIAKSTSESVLCHVSVGHWCELSGADPLGPGRKERCRRLTADVATKVVEILNRGTVADSGASAVAVATDKKKGTLTIGKMRCGLCHDDMKGVQP